MRFVIDKNAKCFIIKLDTILHPKNFIYFLRFKVYITQKKERGIIMQQTKQFLEASKSLLGEKFIAISSEDSIKYNTTEKDGVKLMVSIQDENSSVFLDLIQVKVKNTTPSISTSDLKNIKGKQVDFKNLRIGIYNSQLIFSAEDIFISKKADNTK